MIMYKKNIVILIASLFILTGCATMEGELDSRKIIETADWSRMETVTVKLSEHKFTPSTLTFKTGIPYKLQIKNVGSMKHYFVSEDFFKTIATRKIQSSDGEMKAPYFTAIEIFPGREVDLYFVPVKKGRYSLVCTVPGHAELGMAGTIIVEQSRRKGSTSEGGYGATY
jgi:uncharacterized cupredoxin-like copper-binding protein